MTETDRIMAIFHELDPSRWREILVQIATNVIAATDAQDARPNDRLEGALMLSAAAIYESASDKGAGLRRLMIEFMQRLDETIAEMDHEPDFHADA